MRIDELIKPKELSNIRDFRKDNTPDRTNAQIYIKLKDYGFKLIGDGAFANVYKHDNYPNVVFKIYRDEGGAGNTWLNLCRKMAGSNPFFPRIKSKPIKITDDIFMVRMEELEFHEISTQNEVAEFIDTYFTLVNKEMVDGELAPYVEKHIENMYPMYYELFAKNKHFAQICEIIVELDHDADMHGGNIMWRKNQLVFVDPIADLRYA